MPFQDTVFYDVFQGQKGIKQVRITLVLNLDAGYGENRDELFRFYPFAYVVPVQLFGEEVLDFPKAALFPVPVDFIGIDTDPVPDNDPFYPVKELCFLPCRLPNRQLCPAVLPGRVACRVAMVLTGIPSFFSREGA